MTNNAAQRYKEIIKETLRDVEERMKRSELCLSGVLEDNLGTGNL